MTSLPKLAKPAERALLAAGYDIGCATGAPGLT